MLDADTDEDDVPCPEMFATETMAELSARQGRLADAVAIYRHLVRGAPSTDAARVERWKARLAELEKGAPTANAAAPAPRGDRSPRQVEPAPVEAAAPVPAAARERGSLVVREPVRSGQVIYAEGRDLIVLSPVHPGAQLLADGNIHVYGALKGRAVAGARGRRDAQVFCVALEAELVGVDTGYVLSADIPPAFWGSAARVSLAADGTCAVAALPTGKAPIPAPASRPRRFF